MGKGSSPASRSAKAPRFRVSVGNSCPRCELDELFAAAARDPSHPYIDTVAFVDDVHLVLPAGTRNHYGNHCCDPNLWYVDSVTLAMRRDVIVGEELTSDYGTSSDTSDFAMECSCGSPLCRELVTGEDWRRSELQARYGPHWVPSLVDKINNECLRS